MKVMLVLLLLIIVLFVVFSVLGFSYNAEPATAGNFKAESHPVFDWLADKFGPPGPTLKAPELTLVPVLSPAVHTRGNETAKFVLTGVQTSVFDVAADTKHKFRQAKFVANMPDCADITYETDDGSGKDLHKQHWPAKDKDKNMDPTKVTFQVLSAAGHFSFTLLAANCSVSLE